MKPRVEHLEEAFGIGERSPRLSWRLPPGADAQSAFRVRTTDGQDTGWLPGTDHVLVAWPFAALGPAQRVTWQVRVRTSLGESPWSEPCAVETGLLSPADWSARWIRPAEDSVAPAGQRPGHELRGEIVCAGPVGSARLYATAHGLYEAFVNGVRVGDQELTPGFTQYASRLQTQTYDVSALLRPGVNEITVLLTDGWFRGQVGLLRAADQWGAATAFLAQVHVDGRVAGGTGDGWTSRVSAVRAADLIEGQHADLAAGPGPWSPARLAPELGFDGLVGAVAPPVRRIEELRPVAITTLAPGRRVVDLGQNINGWVRLTGPAGAEVTLTHGEALGADGDVDMTHLAPALPFLPHPLSAGQVDRVTFAGAGVFEPRHTTHGFRYVRITGLADFSADDVTGVVVHSDLTRTGWFSCDDERIERLHEAAVWSFRGNACDIPTDCPTRERAGWTGDWQVFVPAAAFLYDVAGFSTKWLRDLAADQWDTGVVANISPTPPAEGRHGPLGGWNGSAGWGDAAVIVPWEVYRAYGDVRLLAEQWDSMRAWLGFVERSAAAGAHPDPHLWDSGFHWGEWLVPGDVIGDMATYQARDFTDVATAYFYRSASLMAEIAAVLGHDPAPYAELAERVRAAWQAEFVAADGRIRPDTQANLVRALAFGLVPPEHTRAAADRLATLIRDAGTHLATGFLATADLLPVLAEHGHAALAYDLLAQDTEPSWMTMLDRGATTVWEWWDGVNADGVARDSLNHYSKGAVIGFLHRYTAGIRCLEAGYRRFRIAPIPGGGLTRASATHDSPYGRIRSSWEITDGVLRLTVEVPPGTSAEVVVLSTTEDVGPGTHLFEHAY
ncbi:family 78 glycoside hydrolase catalytic domain [Actinoplanes palleronii]|uniref:alpha-L-rhamnosidase n=1 Tax=Actinoplanes palleronii TaxID=113570 RepID=A0ABQ4BFC2_9ACTN|nr:family 78 glycoside hydrolase catalytic domain [Actinoplanes palleronii]GIE69380.1 alpha-L-rhamnosidase [Actinoplanes palleronii]